MLAGAAIVTQRLTEDTACETSVVMESRDGSDRVVYVDADQHGTDVLRFVYLSDKQLPEKFAFAGPEPGSHLATLWLTAPGVDEPLAEGAEFGVGGGSEDRREFAPLALDNPGLLGTAVRPGTGSLQVRAVNDGRVCLLVDYGNEEATLTGTVLITVSDDDRDRGR